MDQVDFVSRGFSGHGRERENLAEGLPPGPGRIDSSLAAARQPQRTRSERIGLTG